MAGKMEHLLALVKPGEPDIAAGKAKQKNADQHAAAETTGKQALYAWADAVLKTCGLDEAVERAKTRDDLDRIKLDRDDPDVMLAIRDALRPVSKHPDEHFRELKPEQLKRLLEIRLNELKKPKFKAIIEKLTKEESADDRKHGVEYYGDNFKVTDRGVFHYRELALKGLLAALLLGEKPRQWVQITRTRIDLLATTRSILDDNWGTYIEITNRDGRTKRLAIPASIVTDEPGNIAGTLQSLGVDVVRNERSFLPGFLLTNVKKRIVAVPSIGWWQLKDGRWAFVLPDETFLPSGFTGEDAVLQTMHLHLQHGFAVAGNVAEWQEQIATPFAGNSNVILAVGQALAGPLTNWAGVAPGFFHLVAKSKFGKSLCSAIGQSIWGPPLIPRATVPDPFGASWDQTSNHLEQFALTRSHIGAFIEEIGQGDQRAIARGIYVVANGIVKGRLRSDLSQRTRHVFVVPGFSSGEESMVNFLKRAGMKVTEGMMTRLADVPATIKDGTVFETYGADAVPDLGKRFYELLGRLHGAVGRAWLRILVDMQPDEIRARVSRHQQAWLAQPAVQARYLTAAQHQRSVIDRFATVAAALRMAIEVGLLPWDVRNIDAGVAASMARWATNEKLNPIVIGILQLMPERQQWDGNATELLAIGAGIPDWPQTKESLGLRLKDGGIKQQLAKSGITIEQGRAKDRKRDRWIRIRRSDG